MRTGILASFKRWAKRRIIIIIRRLIKIGIYI